MSIAALYELQERLYHTAIAGVTMINEDFRLQRSIEQFEQAAGASPVFKKIAEQLKPLREPQASDKTTALMDALALIDAVLYTQGATEVSDELEPVALNGSGSNYNETRYSELHGLKAALTEKGSGRYELVKAAFEAKSPALSDFRLRSVLVAALGDSYSEMADLVAEILASGDSGIVLLLKQHFDAKGKREMARRVEIIEKLAKEQENEFYLSLLEKSSSAVRLAAVHALKHDEANAEQLMSLAETEKGEVREAAYSSLHHLKQLDRGTRAFWLKHAEHSPSEVASYLFDDTGDDLSDTIAGKLRALLDALASDPKLSEKSAKQYRELNSFLYMSTNKASTELIKLFADIAPQAKSLTKVKVQPTTSYGYYGQEASSDLLREINLLITHGIVLNYNERLVEAGSYLYETCGLPYLHAGFCAALVSKPAAEVYEQFAPFLSDKHTAEIIVTALSFVSYDEEQRAHYLYASSFDGAVNWWQTHTGKRLHEQLDPRWLPLLISDEVRSISKYKLLSRQGNRIVSNFSKDDARERYDVMLMSIMNTHHEETVGLLKEHFSQGANECYSEIPVIALHRLGITEFKEWVVGLFLQPSYPHYYLQYLCKRLKLTSEQTIAVLEDLIELAKAKKLKDRYFTVERLEEAVERIRTDEQAYW